MTRSRILMYKKADGDPISFLTNLKTILLPGNAGKVDQMIKQLQSGGITAMQAIQQASELLTQDEEQQHNMPQGEDVMGRQDTALMSNQPEPAVKKAPLEGDQFVDKSAPEDEAALGTQFDKKQEVDFEPTTGSISPFLKRLFKLADDDPFAAMDPEGIKKEVENKRQMATKTQEVASKMEEAGKAVEDIKTKFNVKQ